MLDSDDSVLSHLVQWAHANPAVRTIILTSSRAVPGASVDELSDYDILLVMDDIQPFYDDAGWMSAFGRVLANYRDPLDREGDHAVSAYVTQFEGGLRIDFTLWPAALLQEISSRDGLPPELDAGYRVLLDKAGLAAGLPPPSFHGYLPAPPTQKEFREKLESCFLDALYVAKCLRRGDLVAARHVQETHMKQEHLVPVLEWLGQIEHGWRLRTGPHGRRIETWLRPDLLARLKETYSGLDPDASRASFYATFDLFCAAAAEAAGEMGFKYPSALENQIRSMLSDLVE